MKRMFVRLVCPFVALLFLASCSPAPRVSESAYAPASAADMAPAYEPMESSYAYDESFDDEIVAPLPILAPSSAKGKKMVYTVTLRLQTTSFMAGMRKLLDTVSEMGGYIESANVEGRDLRHPYEERNAYYSFRIPSERLAEFIIVIENNYNLWSLQQETQDTTSRYQRADSDLEDLRAQEQRLLEDLDKTEDPNEKLALELKLSNVQSSIRELNALQASIDTAVFYSTVNVYLYEVIILEDYEPEPELTFGEKFNNAIVKSTNSFVVFCQWVLLAIIAALPVLLILAIIAGIVLIIIRLIKRCREKRRATKEKRLKEKPSEKITKELNNQKKTGEEV